jgi:hypothetical protein
MVADKAACDDACLCPAPTIAFVALEVLLGGDALTDRQPLDVLADPLRCPDALGDLGTVISRYEDFVSYARRMPTRIQVVELPVPGEGHCHHHAHTATIRPVVPWATFGAEPEAASLGAADHNGLSAAAHTVIPALDAVLFDFLTNPGTH